MPNSKVKTVSIGGSWEKDGVTFYTHNYEMEDGQKIQANHKKELPISVGTEVEYEVKRTHPTYGDSGSVKKPNDFKGGKTIKVSLKQIERMAKSNAISAVVTVNSTYNEERLQGKELLPIIKFSMGDITQDINKYSEEEDLFITRLSAVNNAAKMAGYKSFNSAQDLITEANNILKFVK